MNNLNLDKIADISDLLNLPDVDTDFKSTSDFKPDYNVNCTFNNLIKIELTRYNDELKCLKLIKSRVRKNEIKVKKKVHWK